MSPITCNGVRSGAPDYSLSAISLLVGVIGEVRKHFLIGNGEAKGPRFNDDAAVLLRIRSCASEDAAVTAPLSWAHAALQDCASADYHYAYEKEWGGQLELSINDDADDDVEN